MKLVLIEWVDAHSHDRWVEIEVSVESCETALIRSVGWLLKKTKNCVTIAPHISKVGSIDSHVSGDMTIPAKAIRKMTVLRQK